MVQQNPNTFPLKKRDSVFLAKYMRLEFHRRISAFHPREASATADIPERREAICVWIPRKIGNDEN